MKLTEGKQKVKQKRNRNEALRKQKGSRFRKGAKKKAEWKNKGSTYNGSRKGNIKDKKETERMGKRKVGMSNGKGEKKEYVVKRKTEA